MEVVSNINVAYIQSDTFEVTAVPAYITMYVKLQNAPSNPSQNSLEIKATEVFTGTVINNNWSAVNAMWIGYQTTINTLGKYVIRYQLDVEMSNKGFMDDFNMINAIWYNSTLGLEERFNLVDKKISSLENFKMSVFPNPWNSDQLSLTIPETEDLTTLNVRLTNSDGYSRQINHSIILSDNRFYLSEALRTSLPPGIYFVTAENDKRRYTAKVQIF